jgi:hypothetical protein
MKNSLYTQKELVLIHLAKGYEITCLQALRLYGIMYLTKMIQLLRKEGCNIKDEWIKYTTEKGQTKRFKKYFINKKTC